METLSDHNSVAAENNPFRDAKKKGGEFSIESILLAKGQFSHIFRRENSNRFSITSNFDIYILEYLRTVFLSNFRYVR